MRTLTETLLAAQKQASCIPYVKLEASNKIARVTRLYWTRLYNGSEDDYFHALAIPGDGSLIRVRITPPSDSRKLYWQRVANPDPESDFSQWTYANQYNAVIVATASLGAEVSIFWIKSDRKIQRIKSTDYGVSWGSAELVDYSPTTAINGISAAYKANGDIALFFADQSTLYVKIYENGQWQTKSAWDKSTGNLSGAATVYDGDWNLFITGQDTDDSYKLWSLIYGDGGEVAAGSWSELKEFAQAPSGGDFEYHRAFLGKPDVFRGFYIEKFTGSQAYSRPFWAHSIADTAFIDNLWREAVPFNLSSNYGLAIAHHGDCCWLSCPNGVWQASLASQSLELTADVLSLKQETKGLDDKLAVEIRNDDGCFSSMPAPLGIGCQLDFSPGYTTSQGNEASSGHSFFVEACEYTSSGGRASLILYATGGWELLRNWVCRYQLRWNKDSEDTNVKDIIAFILARAGLKLEVISQSSVITGFYPDFTINPGSGGDTVISRLMSFAPDVLFFEGNKAYLINPQAEDNPVYSYITPQSDAAGIHPIFKGHYKLSALKLNRIQVEGFDIASESAIVTESFDWEEIERLYDRFKKLEDINVGSVSQAQARGEAHLRKAEIASANGTISIPVNCGQQLYDVIEITDSRAGLDTEKRRLLGLTLTYNPSRSEYEQRLILGAV
ncbi:MAG: hypothetical protein ABH934_00120 [Chloroflexota bacterium]